MKYNRVVLVIAVLMLVTDLSMIGLYATNEEFSFEMTRLGKTDMVIRTGGRLQDPFQEEYGFPLSHNLSSPGNTSFSGIGGMKSFSVFYQIVFGRNILDGPIQSYEPHFDIPGAIYSFSLNLTSWIHITTPHSIDIYPFDHIENLQLNETTIQVLVLSKEMDLALDNQGEMLEVIYFMTTGSGIYSPFNKCNQTSRFLSISINESVTISIHSEWNLIFATRNLPPIIYSRNETLGSFQIIKDGNNTDVGMSGSFKCYYFNHEVFVLGLRFPYFEIGILAGGIILLFAYQWIKQKEM
ncbi:MAG: hypothetical protein ACTSUO_00080 [Candidatus Thorarchaeota archaeon]